ncbi:MAG: thiamine phosphate synthase [Planctomycetes bacterium]|nr:thiamine phosphate synthase [Planctomycetota bacterium]
MFEASLRLVAVTPDEPALAGDRLVQCCDRLLRDGATALMCREKRLDDLAFLAVAAELMARCQARGARFIVNERFELAAALGAKTVHATHRSPGFSELRARLGPEVRLGVSVHEVEEGVLRAEQGYDYLVFGPVRATPSKQGLVEPRGFRAVETLAHAVDIPVVAIGGLVGADAIDLARRGAAGMAAIRSLFFHPNPEAMAAVVHRAWPEGSRREGS